MSLTDSASLPIERLETETSPNVDAANIPDEGVADAEKSERFDAGEFARKVASHPLTLPAVAVIVAMLAAFWPMTKELVHRWSSDEYYSHGFLVPLLAGWIVYSRWDQIKERPIRPTAWALVPPILFAPLLTVAYRGNMLAILSVLFIIYGISAVAFIAGTRWAAALTPAIGFLLFGLPAWNSIIDAATNPLQLASATVAFQILQLTGFSPSQFPSSPTLIFLNNYNFEVAVACSGMKLLLAVTCFTTLFILIGRLQIIGNLMMAILVVPLCLLMNGLRIAMIGMVGEWQGAEAASKFHDYSGYIMLVLCFFILFRFARLLGWKN